MNEDNLKEYINNCCEDNKIPQGLLSDLCEDTPEGLHSEIMNNINKKRNFKTNFIHCVKQFSAVAALIAIVVLSYKLFTGNPKATGSSSTRPDNGYIGLDDKASKKGMKNEFASSSENSNDKSVDSSFIINYEIHTAVNSKVFDYIKSNCKSNNNDIYILKSDIFDNVVKMIDKNSVKLIHEPKNDQCDIIIQITK